MKYVKSCLIITMLLDVGYSQCDEFNWEEYYPDMAGCYPVWVDLFQANLEGADLWEANLSWANLILADLRNANLYDANLCNLTGSAWGECEQPEGFTDENNDGYDDISYEAGATSGDINLDGSNNILDVISLVNIILNP